MKKLLCLLALLVTTASAKSAIIRLSGTGQTNTDPFVLKAGSYKATLKVTGPCFYFTSLESTAGGSSLNTIANATAKETVTSNLYGVKAGEYYVQVITGPAPSCGSCVES